MEGSTSNLITQWPWESEVLSTVCQDILKWCTSLPVARQRMHRMGANFSLPRIPREFRTRFLVIASCMKTLASDVTCLHCEPKTLTVFMAAAGTVICDEKWTLEYKIPESFWSSINTLLRLSKMEVPEPWSLCPSNLIRGKSLPMAPGRHLLGGILPTSKHQID